MNTFNNNSNCLNSIAFDDVKLIGYFSLKDERNINFDASQLRYYVKLKSDSVYFDLNKGIETTRRYTETFINRHIDKILHWIQKYHGKIISPECESKWVTPDFVCRRGTLEKIFRISCNPVEDVIICAAKWKGTIYLCKFDTEATTISKHTVIPFHKGLPYWSGKFYQYMISETPNGPQNADKPFDQNSQFGGIFLGRLGKHTLLYSGEMNAVYSDKTLEDPLPLDELKFVEFKTNRILKVPIQSQYFKTCITHRWWSQCAPVGVEEIICGFTDEDGIVREIQTYTLEDLIKMSEGYWNPAVSMNFLNNFLSYIASTVVKDCDETIYKFERIPYGDIKLTEVSPSSIYSFLPQWYTRKAD